MASWMPPSAKAREGMISPWYTSVSRAMPCSRQWENTRLSTSSYSVILSSPRVEFITQLPIYTRSSSRRNCFCVSLISIRHLLWGKLYFGHHYSTESL